MASVRKTPSGTWQVRWKTPDRQTRKKTFARKADADRYATSVAHSVLAGSYVDPSAGKITFREYAEGWRNVQVHRASTAAQVETHLRRHIYPRLGERPVGAIRRSEVQAFVRAISDVLAPATVEVCYTWLRTIFKAAVSDRVIATSPCSDVKLPQVDAPRVTPWEPERVGALIDAIPERYRALIVLGAGTGARISDALGLSVDRIDWKRRTVHIDRQLVGVAADSTPVFGPLKDRHNRPRTIPLPDSVLFALVEHCRVFDRHEGLLFVGPGGGPIRRTTWSDTWRRAAEPLGVAMGEGFHALRHFYASTLIQAGESVKVVQERLGHNSATITLDTYGHLWPSDEDRTRSAIDAVLGERLGSIWGLIGQAEEQGTS
jgi:integrase